MDTSKIIANNVTTTGGWHIGDKNAPVKIVEFINFRCPYCKKWWKKSKKTLDAYVNEGKVERIIKHYDKDKESLKLGNVIHRYVGYDDTSNIEETITTLYDKQRTWGELDEQEAAEYAENELGLTKEDNKQEAEEIISEAEKANVELVPTVVVGNDIFDENISKDELKEIIEKHL